MTGVLDVVDELAGDLVALSHDLHAHPETGFREERSSARIAALSAARGLPVTLGAGGLPTAFVGTAGSGPLVTILCEYDALPRLGHACGHNVIAAASLGAALALARVAAAYGGAVRLLGTPAEEGLGGGKELLARAGLLDGSTAAMMVHPGPYDCAVPHVVAALAMTVTTHGRASHASMFPERGVNALDGLVLGYGAMTALRSHLRPGESVTAVVRHGGDAPNIVPDRASAEVLLRSPRAAGLAPLRERVLRCYRGGAGAVGATVRTRPFGLPYTELRPNPPLAAAYERNAAALGRRMLPPERLPASIAGSTDAGNVSQRVPTIHPNVAFAPPEVPLHSRELALAARTPAADRAVLDAAKAMALTAVDLWTRPDLRAAVRHAFEEGRR